MCHGMYPKKDYSTLASSAERWYIKKSSSTSHMLTSTLTFTPSWAHLLYYGQLPSNHKPFWSQRVCNTCKPALLPLHTCKPPLLPPLHALQTLRWGDCGPPNPIWFSVTQAYHFTYTQPGEGIILHQPLTWCQHLSNSRDRTKSTINYPHHRKKTPGNINWHTR